MYVQIITLRFDGLSPAEFTELTITLPSTTVCLGS